MYIRSIQYTSIPECIVGKIPLILFLLISQFQAINFFPAGKGVLFNPATFYGEDAERGGAQRSQKGLFQVIMLGNLLFTYTRLYSIIKNRTLLNMIM